MKLGYATPATTHVCTTVHTFVPVRQTRLSHHGPFPAVNACVMTRERAQRSARAGWKLTRAAQAKHCLPDGRVQ